MGHLSKDVLPVHMDGRFVLRGLKCSPHFVGWGYRALDEM